MKMAGGDSPKVHKIFVGDIPLDINNAELKEHFKKYGQIADVLIVKDKHSKESRGFGFVNFCEKKAMKRALRGASNELFHGIKLEVKKAEPKKTLKLQKVENEAQITKMFVGGIPQDTQAEDLKEYFELYGEVLEASVIKDKKTNHPRRFGFVTFQHRSSIQAAIEDAPKHIIRGKWVDCKIALPKYVPSQEEIHYSSSLSPESSSISSPSPNSPNNQCISPKNPSITSNKRWKPLSLKNLEYEINLDLPSIDVTPSESRNQKANHQNHLPAHKNSPVPQFSNDFERDFHTLSVKSKTSSFFKMEASNKVYVGTPLFDPNLRINAGGSFKTYSHFSHQKVVLEAASNQMIGEPLENIQADLQKAHNPKINSGEVKREEHLLRQPEEALFNEPQTSNNLESPFCSNFSALRGEDFEPMTPLLQNTFSNNKLVDVVGNRRPSTHSSRVKLFGIPFRKVNKQVTEKCKNPLKNKATPVHSALNMSPQVSVGLSSQTGLSPQLSFKKRFANTRTKTNSSLLEKDVLITRRKIQSNTSRATSTVQTEKESVYCAPRKKSNLADSSLMSPAYFGSTGPGGLEDDDDSYEESYEQEKDFVQGSNKANANLSGNVNFILHPCEELIEEEYGTSPCEGTHNVGSFSFQFEDNL